MSLVQAQAEIEYPESDGKPMAESDLHFDWTVAIRDILKQRYRGQRVYVGSDLLVYYVEGNPRKSVAPDEFVVKDCDPGRRRTFKTWEEGRTPDVVIEITSSSTRSEDEQEKPPKYAELGVKEMFLYDPTADYLDPPLQGYRFSGRKKTRIQPDASGALECRELGLHLRLDGGELRIFDSQTGERLLTEAETANARAEAAEDEVRRLREQLSRQHGDS